MSDRNAAVAALYVSLLSRPLSGGMVICDALTAGEKLQAGGRREPAKITHGND